MPTGIPIKTQEDNFRRNNTQKSGPYFQEFQDHRQMFFQK